MSYLAVQVADERRQTWHTLLVVMASIGFGTVPFFARNLTQGGMSPASVAFYRYAFAALALSPFLRLGRSTWTMTLWGIFSGATVALGWIGYVKALETIPVSTVGVIYMTYPVFTLIIGWLFFGERPSRRAVLASLMIVAAAVIASSPETNGIEAVRALLLALLAPIGFGIGINILTRKLVGIPPLSRMACKSLGSVLGLLPLILTSAPSSVVPASPHGWELIAGIALVAALLPQLIYNVCAPSIGATRTGMAGGVELPTMFVVGWLAFGEPLTLPRVLAGVLVIVAIAITPSRRR